MRKVLFLFAFCALFSSVGLAQLDSVSVSVSFSSKVDSTFMDSINVPADYMTVDVWVNDPMLTGNIMVSVYEAQSGHPMARINWNSTTLQSSNSLNGNTFSIPMGFLDSILSYEIRVLVKNAQLSDLPEVIVSYP